MTYLQNTADLESFMQGLSIYEKWISLTPEQQNAMYERAYFDVNAYASIISVDFSLENDFCCRAVFEQTAHIASQYCSETNGRTILQETVTGFGSRKYKDTDNDWLSPRAKHYLEQLKEDPENSENTPGSAPEQTAIEPLRILR